MDLDAIIRRQHGVISRAQAREAGLSVEAVRWRVASGRWSRLAHGLYFAHTGQLTWMARVQGLALRLGPGGALTLDTAAHLHGLQARQPQIITGAVVGRQVQRLPGTRVVRRPHVETSTLRGLLVTSPATTVLDLAALHSSAQWRDIVHLLARWVHSDKVSAEEVLAALDRRGRYGHRQLVRRALGPIAEGVESILEFESLDRVIVRHGLPRPTLQAVHGPEGRRRRDAEWEEFGVVLECDGTLFHTGATLHADRLRDRQAARSGRVTIRAGHVEIVYGACDLALDVFLTLRSRGYRGGIVPCGPRCPTRSATAAS